MKNKGNNHRFLAGSYTVEAAFLIPMILGIASAWMFQLFYLHDQAVISGMLLEAVMQEDTFTGEGYGGREEEEGGGGESGEDGLGYEGNGERLGDSEKETIQSRLWLLRIYSFRRRKGVQGVKYVLRSEAAWDIPVMKRFLKNHFIYCADVEAGKLRPETFVRLKGKEE